MAAVGAVAPADAATKRLSASVSPHPLVVERDTLTLPQRYQRLSPKNERDSYYAPRGGQGQKLRYFSGQ
jgi:hypothetical protein